MNFKKLFSTICVSAMPVKKLKVARKGSLFAKHAFSMFLCLAEVINFIPTASVHATNGINSDSVESSKEDDSEKIFETSEINSEDSNFENVHKLRISGTWSYNLEQKNFPNLNTVIISSDFVPGYDSLSYFLANCCPNVKNIEVQGDNPQYTFEDGLLYFKSENFKNKVWISDDVTETSISLDEESILNPKRSYEKLQKITVTKDIRLNLIKLRSFIEKNPKIKIEFPEDNKKFERKNGEIYYSPLRLPINCEFEKVENLDLFSPADLDVQTFSNLKSITLHYGYNDSPSVLLSFLEKNPSIQINIAEKNKFYTKTDDTLFYEGIPIWGKLDEIREMNLDKDVDWAVKEKTKNLKNLKAINIGTNYSEEPVYLMSIINNNSEATVKLVDSGEREAYYQYDENGILYYKKNTPVYGDFSKIKKLTLDSGANYYSYFEFLAKKNISFNNLETVYISKDFPRYCLYQLKCFLDYTAPNVKKIEVDKEHKDFFLMMKVS